MILFHSDFNDYPSAIVDSETSNKSFLRLATVYRLMGIKNHTFLLALLNPKLQGIDPHSPDLTDEQQAWVAVECKLNPWYFFREVARAPALSGGDSMQFEANRANIAVLWSFFCHIFFILIQPRQTGKSFSIDTLMSLLMNITCDNTEINLLTKDDTLRRTNIQRLKDIMSELPPYLLQRGKHKDDVNNGEEITVTSKGNVYKSHVPQSSKKNALKLGRGLTSGIFQCDEGPFQPNIEIALPAALAAGGAAIEKAKIQGTPYGTILTTTAGKRDDPDGRFIYNLLMESAVWTEKFFDATEQEELEAMVRGSSRARKLQINGTFSHRQLGKSDLWLKERIEQSLQSGDDANRDFFNVWTAGSQTNPLPISTLERMRKSQLDPIHIDIAKPYNYVTRWFIPEDQIHQRLTRGTFILAQDPSEAGGGDDIGMVIVDVESLEVVAAGAYNETNVYKFAQWVCDILVSYDSITAIIERRSMGPAIIDYLLMMLPTKGIDPFKRLYNLVVQEADENPSRFNEIKVPISRMREDLFTRHKKAFGFATSGGGITSRSELYSTTLQMAAKRSMDKLRDRQLIEQISGLVIRNGRVDHAIGEHDDLVVAWLLVHWLLTQGKNLAYYGIDIRIVGSSIKEKMETATPQERWMLIEQQKIRRKIENVYEELSKESDQYIIESLEHELRVLDRRIILEENETYSIDEVIRSAKDARKNRRIFNRSNDMVRSH